MSGYNEALLKQIVYEYPRIDIRLKRKHPREAVDRVNQAVMSFATPARQNLTIHAQRQVFRNRLSLYGLMSANYRRIALAGLAGLATERTTRCPKT